ncbi:MAG: bifunctional hydroxymethylpyrimidine kinase/phosphomethylpyrimidine kinase [Acidimicrobiales bacterium]
MQPPTVLTVAGSDSGAGAGLQADLKTFAANGVFGTTVVTAVTAQNTAAVLGVFPVAPEFVDLQLRAVLSDLPVTAVKTGMLGSSAVVELVGRWAASGRLPNLVVDPVLASSTGEPLLDEGGVAAYLAHLVPHALAVTPNLREAELLVGAPVADVDAMAEAARSIAALGPALVVVKGGHLDGGRAPDVAVVGGEISILDAPRVETRNDHGTGCSLSAALTARLAHGDGLAEALTAAKSYVHGALQGAASWRLGAGHGPIDHFGWDGPLAD